MNDTLAEDILTQTRKTLHSTGLKFSESHAGILSGSVEGSSGWLTVNYLNNNLLRNVKYQINLTEHSLIFRKFLIPFP